jgi:hypothetical protein
MAKIILVSIVITGLIAIISGIHLKPAAISKSTKSKTVKMPDRKISEVLEYITDKKIIKLLLNLLTRNKNICINRFATWTLEVSEVRINLQQFYLLKISCSLVCILLVVLVNYSNTNYQIKKLVLSADSEKSFSRQENADDESKYILYRQIVEEVGKNVLLKAEEAQRYNIVKEAMTERLKTSDNYLIEEETNWFIKTWKEVDNISAKNYRGSIIILLSPFMPEILLIVIWLIRGCVYRREIIKLEYIFELLATIDGIKTSDIIYELENSSKIYSKYLQEFRIIFQYDKKNAFNFLKACRAKNLSRLAAILEIYSMSDRGLALQILDREVMERDESLLITSEESIDFVDLVAFLSIAPLVYELARLMLSPMLDIIYKAFEFI